MTLEADVRFLIGYWIDHWKPHGISGQGIKSAGLAEGVGFEPTVPLQARRFSRPLP